MDDFQRSARVSSPAVQRLIEDAGYIDFQETIIRCCVNPWCDDPAERLAANWFNICLTESIEALGLAPLVEKCAMSIPQFQILQARVKKEICNIGFRAYFNL